MLSGGRHISGWGEMPPIYQTKACMTSTLGEILHYRILSWKISSWQRISTMKKHFSSWHGFLCHREKSIYGKILLSREILSWQNSIIKRPCRNIGWGQFHLSVKLIFFTISSNSQILPALNYNFHINTEKMED